VIGSSDTPAPARNPFPFKEPANVLDRDRIVIPAGWDSYGKISILREGFQPARWAEAYDADLESLSESNPQPDPEGARAQFSALVGGDRGPPPRTLPAIIQPTPEQVFLQQHYETLAKDPTRDPRVTFKQPVGAEERFGGATGASGVVGPMSSSSFSLPSVEKALVEMEGGGERHRESVSERERPGPVKPGVAPPRRVRVALISPSMVISFLCSLRTLPVLRFPRLLNTSRPRIPHEPPLLTPLLRIQEVEPSTRRVTLLSFDSHVVTILLQVLHHFFQSLLTKGASKPLATGTTGTASSPNRASSGTQTSGPANERDREGERPERERQGDGTK
jgi:Dynein light intermediate chain (DLIC)